MPRTKTAKSSRNTENIKPTKFKLHQHMVDSYFEVLEAEVANVDDSLETERKHILMELNTMLTEHCLKFPHDIHKTIEELKVDKLDIGSVCEISSFKSDTVNATLHKSRRLNRTTKVADIRRSISLRSVKHSNIKKAKATTRVSRSLSRSKLQQTVKTLTSFNTPLGQNISNATFGMVTPKVKPNTPQVVLRRPKQGEMAISMQGSPLMVSSVTSDQKANVNIPLSDGRILSIQPQRGLRASQIPIIDEETKRQIQTLRDNLNKVCALTARR